MFPQSSVVKQPWKSQSLAAGRSHLTNDDAINLYQAQNIWDGDEDVAECQPLFGQTCLHRRGSDFVSKLQSTMSSEEVVMASQQLQMIFQRLRTARVTKAPATQVCRALPDGQVQSFNVGSIQLARILRVSLYLIPAPSRTKPRFSLHFDHAIIPSLLDDLAVQASCPKESPDNLPIELEPIGNDQSDVVSIGPGAKVSKQGECVPITPLSNNSRRPEARAYFDSSKDPNGRLLFATDYGADLIGLQFADPDLGDPLMVESTTGGSSFLQPVIDGVPSDLLDSGDGRLVHTLDTKSGDFIERSAAMLEAVIDTAAVPAESPAATLASKPTALAPPSLVESKTNDHSQRWFCSQQTHDVWTAQFLHGPWTRLSVDLATSKIALKPYHMNRLQSP